MKIIGKYKDYYDYIQGIYGIDEDIVFDRRNVIYNPSNTFTLGDIERYLFWHREEEYPIILETGFIHYMINVDKKKDTPIIILCSKVESNIHIGETPITFIDAYYGDFNIRKGYKTKPLSEYTPIDIHQIKNDIGEYRITDLPLLKNTFIPSIIPAEEIYNNIYNYLLYMKEPRINDNRTNKEKIEGRGFDYKESFRNTK